MVALSLAGTPTADDEEAFGHTNDLQPVDHSDAAPTTPVSMESCRPLATQADIERRLAELTTASDAVTSPASLVLVELDSAELDFGAPEDRLLTGIAKAALELLSDAHSAARVGNQRLMLFLPGDDEAEATQRAEHLRQRVEATEFLVNDSPLRATVTCALAQVSADLSVDDLLASLQETLAEAQRLGGNRTFQYDGMTPTPVVPPELNLAPQTCAL
jgi:GGDEF domain-containing protein